MLNFTPFLHASFKPNLAHSIHENEFKKILQMSNPVEIKKNRKT